MTIVLTFATEEGEEKKVKFVDNVTDIELNIDAFGIQKLGPRSETIDLTPLQSCTDLRTLSIWGFSLREIDLSPLSNCRNLESLRVSAMMWSPIDLSPLKSCPNLRNLCLSGNYFRELDITPLKHCHDLQSLELYSTFIKTIDLCPLKYCVRLKSFAVSTALEHIDLTPFGLCTDLRFLDLGRNQLQDLDLEPLCSCTRLQELHLEKNHLNSIDLGPLASCAYLRSVRLEGNRFKTIDLSPLSSCSRLSKIFLHGNMMEELDITPLQFLPGLEEIRFHNTSKLSSWIKYPRLNWPLVQKYRGDIWTKEEALSLLQDLTTPHQFLRILGSCYTDWHLFQGGHSRLQSKTIFSELLGWQITDSSILTCSMCFKQYHLNHHLMMQGKHWRSNWLRESANRLIGEVQQ